MKRASFILLFGIVFLLAANLIYAQEETTPQKTRVGFGLTIVDFKELLYFIYDEGGIAPGIFMPIDISPAFRIEPEIGFYRTSSESESNGDSDKYTISSFNGGLGIFPMKQKENLNLYYGVRLGITKTSSLSEYSSSGGYEDKSEQSGTGFYLSPTFGGEYFLSTYFSVGGEMQLKYSTLNWKDKDNEDEKNSTSSLSSRTLIFVRIYF